jgi:hypothetical protein
VEAPRVLGAIAQAPVETGVPATPDFNTGDDSGAGPFRVNQERASIVVRPHLFRSGAERANLRLETKVARRPRSWASSPPQRPSTNGAW